jgi:hypothetical protein
VALAEQNRLLMEELARARRDTDALRENERLRAELEKARAAATAAAAAVPAIQVRTRQLRPTQAPPR